MDTILDEIMDEAAMLGRLRILPSQATDIEILQALYSTSGLEVGQNSVSAKLAISSFRNAIIVNATRQLH